MNTDHLTNAEFAAFYRQNDSRTWFVNTSYVADRSRNDDSDIMRAYYHKAIGFFMRDALQDY